MGADPENMIGGGGGGNEVDIGGPRNLGLSNEERSPLRGSKGG